MKPVMGIAVGQGTLRAVLVRRRAIQWAGAATYTDLADLAEVLARLAAQGNGVSRPRRVVVVLERALVQLRTVLPAPPLRPAAAHQWVALEAGRLFRKNGAPLVTAARIVRPERESRALLAAATPEPLVQAILSGCNAAGLKVDQVGPATEALPHALAHRAAPGAVALPNGHGTEMIDIGVEGAWRSRWVRAGDESMGPPEWAPGLHQLESDAPAFAAAYGATVMPEGLALFPDEIRRERQRHSARRVARLALVGACLWLAAGVVHLVRLSLTVSSSTSFLAAVQPAVDSALALRRELRAAAGAMEFMAAAERHRSSHLQLLAQVTAALPDSMHLVAVRVSPDGTVRLSGHAPLAARALAAAQRAPRLRQARLEGPADRGRFAIVARVGPL